MYLNSSDLVIASIPLPSATSLIDAVNLDKPILALENKCGHLLDYVIESPAYCKTVIEMQEKSVEILNSETIANLHKKSTKKSLDKFHSLDKWLENVDKLYSEAPNKHSVNSFNNKIKKLKIYYEDIVIAHVFHNIVEKYNNSKEKLTVTTKRNFFRSRLCN